MKSRFLPLLMVSLWIASTCCYAQEASAGKLMKGDKVNDVRILIDISGSMKKNDPNNLRIPALRLITQLLPDGSKGGVWIFGTHVSVPVPPGKVNNMWKDQAYAASSQIHSKGLYTNIEDVLKKSTLDLKKTDNKVNRSIIFLTDGVVDISKNRQVNKRSRQRILNKVLPRLKEADVKIHTIALSKDADRAFLKQLSAATSGWYEEADSAEKLERIFLRMFEKSVPIRTLPLIKNRVLVDSSIRELTLLIFRKKATDKVSAVLPNGKEINSKTKQSNVRWRHEARYDLITVDKPMAGEWQVKAELDPDNRVIVVTDLSVRASKLPNVIMNDEAMPFFAELHQNGKTITKPIFLDLVNIKMDRKYNDQDEKEIVLMDDGLGIDKKARDGRYSTNIGGELLAGQYEYELVVDGTTFKRNKRYVVQVVDKPVSVTIRKEGNKENPVHYSLILTPYPELIKVDSLLIDTTVSKEGGGSAAVNIPRTGPGEWRLDLNVKEEEYFNVAISVQAERLNGQSSRYDLGSYRIGKGILDEMAARASAREKGFSVQQMLHDISSWASTTADNLPAWTAATAKVVGLNAILILLGFIIYRKWFRSAKDDDDTSESEEGNKEPQPQVIDDLTAQKETPDSEDEGMETLVGNGRG